MLSILLFIVFFSLLSWLSKEPHRTSDQNQHSDTAVTDTFPAPTDVKPDEDKSTVEIIDNRTPISEQPTSMAAKEQLTTDIELASSESAPPEEMPSPTPVEEQEPASIATVASPDAPVSQPSAEQEETSIEPVLTEEEAIALAVETTLAEDATPKASEGDREGTSELVRPNPPDPELVEVAIHDALEKSEQFSPPETPK